jgi:hypothetical protein
MCNEWIAHDLAFLMQAAQPLHVNETHEKEKILLFYCRSKGQHNMYAYQCVKVKGKAKSMFLPTCMRWPVCVAVDKVLDAQE